MITVDFSYAHPRWRYLSGTKLTGVATFAQALEQIEQLVDSQLIPTSSDYFFTVRKESPSVTTHNRPPLKDSEVPVLGIYVERDTRELYPPYDFAFVLQPGDTIHVLTLLC